MSHQKHTGHDAVKEPHSVSVKVLRLSHPSLETQYAIEPPPPSAGPGSQAVAGEGGGSTRTGSGGSAPASLAYASPRDTNTDPFLLSPILNLPASFGSAYVGETFSCTLCANNDLAGDAPKQIRDVRIEAEMKTPGPGGPQRLELGPGAGLAGGAAGVDLAPGETLQKVLGFDLKEEGNHVLAVTVSYYEATETSGRTRTFRKLYQFICKPSLIVRTKVSSLGAAGAAAADGGGVGSGDGHVEAGRDGDGGEELARPRQWVLEAQLENCSEDVMLLEKVVLDVEDNLTYEDCNWDAGGGERPVLQPAEIEQVCFVVREKAGGGVGDEAAVRTTPDGRLIFGVLGIGWRGEMGKRGFLSTGKLGARISA